jgi:two-component system chemotaxis response regulator CheY
MISSDVVPALVVDDSRAIRLIIGRILRELGFSVSEASNGREALDALGSLPVPRVIMVDWNMPEMNGLEFVRAARLNEALAGTRLIMITSENEIGRVQEALEAGADEYIMKPFSRDMIQEKLAVLDVTLPKVIGA